MNLHQNRYGTFGSGPPDRDQERLERELFVERGADARSNLQTSTPHRTIATFLAAQITRLRAALAKRHATSGIHLRGHSLR